MTTKISSAEIRDALARSGYLLETRLEDVLRGDDFYVEANSAYLDFESSKSRELDLFAMKGYKPSPYPYELIYSVLLIEAINNPQPIAFITKESQISPLHREDIKVAGLPVKLPSKSNEGEWVFLPEYLEMDNYHHYCRSPIATQYCSFTQKKSEYGKKEWMASHEEAHFNSFRTLSVAVEYVQDVLYHAWKKNADAINLEFYYPIVVVQGELLEVHSEIDINPTNHIKYRRPAIVDSKEFTYQIGVVTEEYFPSLLRIIDGELEHTSELIQNHDHDIRTAIKTLVSEAGKASTFSEIKSALSYHY